MGQTEKKDGLIDMNNKMNTIQNTCGRLTQGPECYLHTVEVTGSNPVSPTIFFSITCAIPLTGKTAGVTKTVTISMDGSMPTT